MDKPSVAFPRLNIAIDPEQFRALKIHCAVEGLTITMIVADLVRKFLDRLAKNTSK